MATLYCPCGEAHKLWGEFWWAGGQYRWVFFDDAKTSETYAEQVENCPACARRLERKDLISCRPSFRSPPVTIPPEEVIGT